MRAGLFIRGFVLLLAVLAIGAGSAAAAKPTIIELPEATHATPIGIGPDGSPWFRVSHGTEWQGRKGSRIGTLSGSGSFVEHRIAPVGQLVTDPVGGFWGVEEKRTGDKGRLLLIARIDGSDKVVRTYPVGTSGGRNGSTITTIARADGAVWFLRSRFDGRWSVERLSTADGSVKAFPLRRRCRSSGLAVAADGSAWFTETCRRYGQQERGSGIGRIARDGSVSRWPLRGRAAPRSVTIGKNGTVWFAMSRGFKAPEIGRITAASDIAEFPIRHGYLPSFAVGPEGRLWFGTSFGEERRAAALDSIGVGGHLSKPICAEPNCRLEVEGIVAAPNGSLWYGLTAPNLNTGGAAPASASTWKSPTKRGRSGTSRSGERASRPRPADQLVGAGTPVQVVAPSQSRAVKPGPVRGTSPIVPGNSMLRSPVQLAVVDDSAW
jgi:streptogramin lyase